MDAFANSWIDCMKLVVCSTVPDIVPFIKAESGNTRHLFTSCVCILAESANYENFIKK